MRDRREILEGIVRQLFVQERIGRMAARHHDQRVAVRRRRHQRLRGDHAARARTVFDDDGLAPFLRDRIAQRARQNIDRTAGRIGHQDMHGLWTETAAPRRCPRRPALRLPPSTSGTISWHSPELLVGALIAHRRVPRTVVRRRSRIRPGHVDNPGDRVKFRRLDYDYWRSCRERNIVARHRENSMAVAEAQTKANPRVPPPGTAWCCNPSSATTSDWCPMCRTGC